MGSAIDRLDKLDGLPDRTYTGIPLYDMNTTTGRCHALKTAKQQAGQSVSGLRVDMATLDGKDIRVNCYVLYDKLRRLVEIAEKLPTRAYYAGHAKLNAKQRRESKVPLPSADSLFGYYVLGNMIRSLVYGEKSESMALHQLMGGIDFLKWSRKVQQMGKKNFHDVETHDQAFRVLRKLGRKHRFKAQDFKAPKPSGS